MLRMKWLWFLPNLMQILSIFLQLQAVKQSGPRFFGLPGSFKIPYTGNGKNLRGPAKICEPFQFCSGPPVFLVRPLSYSNSDWLVNSSGLGTCVQFPRKKLSLRLGNARLQKWRAWERRNFPCVSILQLEYGHFALIVLPWNFLVHGNKFGGMPFLMPPMTNTTVGDSGTRSNTRSLRENPAP